MTDDPRDAGAGPEEPEQDRTAREAAEREAARRRARRRAEVFGDVLPELTRDDRDPGSPSEGNSSEEWLKRQVPPHHG